jgi:outer membrane protein assembly factor BamB
MRFLHQWSHDLHQRPPWDALLATRPLVTVERRNRLVRLDPDTGAMLWEVRVGGPWGWLAGTPKLVGYLCERRWLSCVDVANGALRWERPLGEEGAIYGRLVATDEYLLVGGWRGYTPLHCLDSHTGAERWRTPEARAYAPPIPGPWGVALPNVAAGVLLIVDPQTGAALRRFSLPADIRESDRQGSVQRHGQALLATTARGDLLLLDPATDRGWRALGVHAAGIATVRPTLLGDLLLFQETAGSLCAYDLAAGRPRWSSPVPHRGERLPAVLLSQGRVAVGTSEGRLVLLDDRGQQLGGHTVGKRITTALGGLPADRIVFGTNGALVAYQVGE